MAAMKEFGCICCRILLGEYVETEVNHILSGGVRVGHEATYCLCPWHHRGVPNMGWTARMMEDRYGPSLARGSKPFHRAFGSDAELLDYQNKLLKFGAKGLAPVSFAGILTK
jgi:hypothetical protein